MKTIKTILTSATAIGAASLAFSTPAAAQYYPYGGYGNQGANVVTQILGQILGYGTYPYGNYGYGRNNQYSYQQQQAAVNQCARAAEARLNGHRGNGYGYGQQGYGYPQGRYGYPQAGYPVPGTPVPQQGYGYPNQGYNNQGYPVPGTPVPQGAYGYPSQPVNAAYANRVTGITKVKRTSYGHKVYGVASATDGYSPYEGRYGRYSRPMYEWDCEIDRRGRIRDIDVDRVKSRDYDDRYRRY